MEAGFDHALDDATEEPEAAPARLLRSALPGVPDEAWTEFVSAMVTSTVPAVSASNALGMFELTPRRLADLGLVRRLTRTRSPAGKTIWVAAFMPPLTCDTFLRSPSLQYRVFAKSMQDYAHRIADGDIEPLEDVSLSGNLAILHKCGPSGLKTWASSERFPATVAVFERANGVF